MKIVVTIGGEDERRPTAIRGWYINRRYKPWGRDDRAITSRKISIEINAVPYSVSCYVKSTDEGARVFRCPAPLIMHTRFDKLVDANPGENGNEYEFNTTIWMKPNSGDNVVTAWKHIRQDPYAE